MWPQSSRYCFSQKMWGSWVNLFPFAANANWEKSWNLHNPGEMFIQETRSEEEWWYALCTELSSNDLQWQECCITLSKPSCLFIVTLTEALIVGWWTHWNNLQWNEWSEMLSPGSWCVMMPLALGVVRKMLKCEMSTEWDVACRY